MPRQSLPNGADRQLCSPGTPWENNWPVWTKEAPESTPDPAGETSSGIATILTDEC